MLCRLTPSVAFGRPCSHAPHRSIAMKPDSIVSPDTIASLVFRRLRACFSARVVQVIVSSSSSAFSSCGHSRERDHRIRFEAGHRPRESVPDCVPQTHGTPETTPHRSTFRTAAMPDAVANLRSAGGRLPFLNPTPGTNDDRCRDSLAGRPYNCPADGGRATGAPRPRPDGASTRASASLDGTQPPSSHVSLDSTQQHHRASSSDSDVAGALLLTRSSTRTKTRPARAVRGGGTAEAADS